MTVVLITPSFSRDFPLAKELCASIDRHNEDNLQHILVVPKSDLSLFEQLKGPNRSLISKESVLSPSPIQLPLPTIIGFPGLFQKRIRTVWLGPGFRPVRGWILQQVIKLSADLISPADTYVFLDSDAVMVRAFSTETFEKDGLVPMVRVEGALSPDNHDFKRWQDVACDLLGIDRFPFEGDSNIAVVVSWRQDRLKELQARIEEVTGRPYQEVLCTQSDLSEYVLYNTFCLKLCAPEHGHDVRARSMCHEAWGYDMGNADDRERFAIGLANDHIAVLIESTQEWSMEKRRAVISEITARAGL